MKVLVFRTKVSLLLKFEDLVVSTSTCSPSLLF